MWTFNLLKLHCQWTNTGVLLWSPQLPGCAARPLQILTAPSCHTHLQQTLSLYSCDYILMYKKCMHLQSYTMTRVRLYPTTHTHTDYSTTKFLLFQCRKVNIIVVLCKWDSVLYNPAIYIHFESVVLLSSKFQKIFFKSNGTAVFDQFKLILLTPSGRYKADLWNVLHYFVLKDLCNTSAWSRPALNTNAFKFYSLEVCHFFLV